MILTYIIVAVVAYLFGSIPFGYILMRVFRGVDVRSSGSGNIGATNVARSSKGLGIATLLLDALKGFAAVMIGGAIATAASREALTRFGSIVSRPPSEPIQSADTGSVIIALGLAALFAMIGHIFPVWLKFKGGKGVATGVGVFLAIAWQPVLIVLVAFAVIYALTKYVSLGSIVATAAFPVVAYFFVREWHDGIFLMPFIIAAAALIIAKHHQNIRRLLSGTEHRLDLKSSRPEPNS